MNHPGYGIRSRGDVAHAFQRADATDGWYSSASMCGKVFSCAGAAPAGDGRKMCRMCARALVAHGLLEKAPSFDAMIMARFSTPPKARVPEDRSKACYGVRLSRTWGARIWK